MEVVESPASKRSERDVEDEAEEEVQVPAKRRRRRRQLQQDEDNDEHDNQEEEDEEAEEVEEEEDEEAVVEEDEEEDEEDEEEDTTNTACVRRQINAPGKPPEAGIILQVYVENFMCHRKFSVDLCRNVNFITGQNGSGKSAILAAIQICLGAGARSTHRARNLKDLVRKDAAQNAPTHATIRVSLLNCGADAYQHDTYGDVITVERTIALKGGFSGYKLLDENKNEKSRSKKDLAAMLDQLNIQVDNPVAVLDQEEAKKFLTGKAEDKYKFFMKATELARVSVTSNETAQTIDELQTARDKIAASLTAKKMHVHELRRKWEEHQALDSMREKLLSLQMHCLWAYFGVAHKEHEDAVATVAQYQEKVAQKERELAEAERAANNPHDEESERRQRLEELSEEAKKQTDLKNQLETDLRQLQGPVIMAKRDRHGLASEKKQARKALATAQQRLQQARDQIMEQAGSAESDQARRAAALVELEEQWTAAKAKSNELRQTVSTCLREYETLEPQVMAAREQVRMVNGQLQGLERKLQDLESSSSDSFGVLGARVRNVFNMVEEAKKQRKFRGPVVGPIGHYVKVVPGKEEWAAIAELALGNGTLDRFIVTNDADRRLLNDIRKKAGCTTDCGLFQIGNNPRFQIQPPPSPDVETVATVLSISDDLVFNCLVDNSRIDQRALCRDKETSERQLLYKNERAEDAIRGIIKEVYFLPHGSQWMVKNGSRAIFDNRKKLRKTIGVDRTAAIRDAVVDIEALQQELAQKRRDESKLEQEHTKYQRDWNNAKKAMQMNDKEIQNISVKVDEARAEIETSESVTFDTTEYEEDVARAEEELENLDRDDAKLLQQIEDAQPEIDDMKKRIDECDARNVKVLADMAAATEELTQLLDTKTQQTSLLEKKRKKIQKYRDAIDGYRSHQQQLEHDKNEALYNARLLSYRLRLCEERNKNGEHHASSDENLDSTPPDEELQVFEPIKVQKSSDYYEARISKQEEQIKKEQARRKVGNEDPAVAKEKYKRALADYADKKRYVAEIDQKVDNLQKDMLERQSLWKKMRKALERTTTVKFDELLTLNQYSGTAEFDHGSETLELKVSKESATGPRNNDVKSLSGGERSYTTMCLLLALGEKLETPFRILDEYDVFLDAPTRKLTTSMLIHLAQTKMEHRQFIFITPQDLSGITPDPRLKILKLRPPERHEMVGRPTQQTLDFTQS